MGRATWALRRRAPTATTDIILTPAPLTATTGLAGFLVDYLSELGRGMAVGAVVAGATAARAGATVEATTVDAGSSAGADTRVATVAAQDFTVQRPVASTAEAGSMAAEVAASTVGAVMVAAADTGNRPRF